MLNTKTIQRLLRYSAGTLGVMCTQEAAGQVMYTDIDPDTVLEFGGPDTYVLDLDNNGTDDFVLQMISTVSVFTTSSGMSSTIVYAVEITPLGDAEIKVTDGGDALVMGAGEWVDDAAPDLSAFSPDAAVVADLNLYVPQFLALRFTIDGNAHYGWLRLLAGPSGEVILKDHAYETVPETPLYTQIPAGPIGVNAIALADVSDTHTVADLQVSFDVPDDESTIIAYRIFAGVFSFDTYAAATASSLQYTEVYPTGADQSVTLHMDQLDRLGQEIAEFDLLRVSVMSVGAADAFENVLVHAPEPIVLGHVVMPPTYVEVITESAASPSAAINTTFGSPADMDGIINFFSYVVPADMLGVLDTSSLCANPNRIVLNAWEVPGGIFSTLDDYAITVAGVDVQGDALAFGEAYAVCVQSHTLWDEYSGCVYEQITCSPTFIPEEEVLSVSDHISNDLQLFVSQDGIHVHCRTEQGVLELYGVTGQLIYQLSLNDTYALLPLPKANGWYAVALRTPSGLITKSLLITQNRE